MFPERVVIMMRKTGSSVCYWVMSLYALIHYSRLYAERDYNKSDFLKIYKNIFVTYLFASYK